MRPQRGFSLVVAGALVILLFMLAMVTFDKVMTSSVLGGGINSQNISLITGESGFHRSVPIVFDDAPNSFQTILAGSYVFPDSATSLNDEGYMQAYTLDTLQPTYQVTFDDNDDLDGDDQVDTDERIIVNMEGFLTVGGEIQSQARINALIQYFGENTGYAQDTGSAPSTSNFQGEINVGTDLSTQ